MISFRLLSSERWEILESRISIQTIRGKEKKFITCLSSGREVVFNHNEVLRQLLFLIFRDDFGYQSESLRLRHVLQPNDGGQKITVDGCVNLPDQEFPQIVFDISSSFSEHRTKVVSLCKSTKTNLAIWSDGDTLFCYQYLPDQERVERIPCVPHQNQSVMDVLSKRWTIQDLYSMEQPSVVSGLIAEVRNELLINAGFDVFEELFKLIFVKLYDEFESLNNRKRHLVFRNYGEHESTIASKIEVLFREACENWSGVFSDGERLNLSPKHLIFCVSSLESVNLLGSNLDLLDDVFEHTINRVVKMAKGQFFTPRHIIEMCVKMLNPKEYESMIDTAAGGGGFLVQTIFYVWTQIALEDSNGENTTLFANENNTRFVNYVRQRVFGIDFDSKAVRLGRTLNLIMGGGEANTVRLDTLDYLGWDNAVNDDKFSVYRSGWDNLNGLRQINNTRFDFDIVMTNPPFSGDVKNSVLLSEYDLAKKVSMKPVKPTKRIVKDALKYPKKELLFPDMLSQHGTVYEMNDGSYQRIVVSQRNRVSRDILFIERNLNFLKPGGRMAIVLPQGIFNNISAKYVRDYICSHCRVLAVVGLHANAFKPHTGVKTSVIFLQKWDDTLCPKADDYQLFFAIMQKETKDNSGRKIYIKDSRGDVLLDSRGQKMIDHDLFSQDGVTEDGIFEAFREFGIKENLSFLVN